MVSVAVHNAGAKLEPRTGLRKPNPATSTLAQPVGFVSDGSRADFWLGIRCVRGTLAQPFLATASFVTRLREAGSHRRAFQIRSIYGTPEKTYR